MILDNLYNRQKKLDELIAKNHDLEDRNLEIDKVLSFQVEVAECANEWQMFKFWKVNPRPRTTKPCRQCNGEGKGYFSGKEWTGHKMLCTSCHGSGIAKGENPLLEEYVDGLHFLLSMGLDLEAETVRIEPKRNAFDTNEIFSLIFATSGMIRFDTRYDITNFYDTFSLFLRLGIMLGFSWEEIELAYIKKNRINLERQANGY